MRIVHAGPSLLLLGEKAPGPGVESPLLGEKRGALVFDIFPQVLTDCPGKQAADANADERVGDEVGFEQAVE